MADTTTTKAAKPEKTGRRRFRIREALWEKIAQNHAIEAIKTKYDCSRKEAEKVLAELENEKPNLYADGVKNAGGPADGPQDGSTGAGPFGGKILDWIMTPGNLDKLIQKIMEWIALFAPLFLKVKPAAKPATAQAPTTAPAAVAASKPAASG